MHITLLGTGAMACLFGARLASYAEVTLLGTWPAGIAAIDERGIRLEGPEGTHSARVRATADERQAAPADAALILVKSWQTQRAARQAAQVLAPAGYALTLQNGLGNLEQIAEVVDSARALLGVTTMAATLIGRGHVREGGQGPIHLPDDARPESLVDVLRSADFEVLQHPASDLRPLLWGKVAINCGINALTAILRIPNGELLERPDARELMERAASEAAEVARANGIAAPYADAARQVREVALATAGNRSSMLQDILRGAPTEIDAINGAVVREGRRLGVPAPVNEVLWRLVRSLNHRLPGPGAAG